MILQALKEYYERKSMDPDGRIAPDRFEYKDIPFVIVIDEKGGFVQIEDTRYLDGKQLRSKSFLVPQAEKCTSGIQPNLLWDSAEYVFGLCVKEKSDAVRKKHDAFIARIQSLDLAEDIGVKAVCLFLSSGCHVDALEQSAHALEIKEKNPFMAFRLNNETDLVCQRKAVIKKVQSALLDGARGVCLISGETQTLARLQPAIKGVHDRNMIDRNLVSFNRDSFNSFGKTQGANAQISIKSAFKYTTALNYLLRRDSPQKMQIADATTVFWSERASDFEHDFSSLFNEPFKEDNPDNLVSKVKALFQAVDTGVLTRDNKTNCFYILGLSPNRARISVRFWQVATIAELSQHIVRHFRDLELIHAPHQKEYLSLWELLRATAAQEKSEHIVPRLGGEWMRTILSGQAYPEFLFQAVLRRIQAERAVTYPRAAILKACLNRKARFLNYKEEEITVSLDKENKNQGYKLGRLFAVLEKIQEEANPGINATIRDRYYSAGSCTPASVFPNIIRLKNHHLAKLEKGRVIYFERLLGAILSDLSEFPLRLNVHDQGRFAIGYYHQRQAFFTKIHEE